MWKLNLHLLGLIGSLNVNFMDQIHLSNQDRSHLTKITILE